MDLRGPFDDRAIEIGDRIGPVGGRGGRGHQGWRYLAAADAPPDLGEGEEGMAELPPDLAGKLAVLALI